MLIWFDLGRSGWELAHNRNTPQLRIFDFGSRIVLPLFDGFRFGALPSHLSILAIFSEMNVQIFGRRDCSESRKAERWFKERKIPFQFIDLKEKNFSPRELEGVARPIGYENLLDKDSRRFKEKGLAFMSPSRIPKVLLEDALLFKTPVVRNGPQATLGFQPETWKGWE